MLFNSIDSVLEVFYCNGEWGNSIWNVCGVEVFGGRRANISTYLCAEKNDPIGRKKIYNAGWRDFFSLSIQEGIGSRIQMEGFLALHRHKYFPRLLN